VRYSTQIKPISYLKAHAAEMFADLAERQQPYIITQNGEAKAVVMDVKTYEQSQETLALLKLISLSRQEIESGQTVPVEEAFDSILRQNGS
jgi:prevent-host-death family protein